MDTAKKTVIVVEDDLLLQREIVDILSRAPDIECLLAVGSGEEALIKIPARKPDVVLMDIKLPGLSGIDCVKILKNNNPAIEIIMLTVYQNYENIFEALKAGANGYLLKATDPNTLYDAIRNVYSGGAPFTGYIARKIAENFREPPKVQGDDEVLTKRELQVLDMLSTGCMYKDVGAELGIGYETVKTHVRNICAKLHVRNRTAAIAKHFATTKSVPRL